MSNLKKLTQEDYAKAGLNDYYTLFLKEAREKHRGFVIIVPKTKELKK